MEATKPIAGLSDKEVIASQKANGFNVLVYQQKHQLLRAIGQMVIEPMFLLLVAASSLYYITGDYADGIFMSIAIFLVAFLSLYQEARSRNAIDKLHKLSQPNSKVIRNSTVIEIPSEEIVLGDCIQIEEGSFIPADATLLQSNDFSVDEAILTGESLAIIKNENTENNKVFQGTNVAKGMAIAKVTAIGNLTALGKIGKSLQEIKEEKTPLQIQITAFVKKMSFIGLCIFALVWALNYFHSKMVLGSLLNALTIAMSVIPEEIPVAFTTFMALGAWRLLKMGIIAKETKTVETLGSATVICTDKTGTITENKMSLAEVYVLSANTTVTFSNPINDVAIEVLTTAMWSSEPIPFDAMELAIHEAYNALTTKDDRPDFKLVHEYPLSGNPPMMTHVFENATGTKIIATKGAPEAIMAVSQLSDDEHKQITTAMEAMMIKGFRVLGVGSAKPQGSSYPMTQQEIHFKFIGLVAFYDPPKANMKQVFDSFYKAGIQVKIVTGDNAATTQTIANQVGFKDADKVLNGDELMAMDKATLNLKVMETTLFTRMFPEAKLRIIQALKDNNQIVAMTGDGVNDGPALKSSHIGIAMGKKGTEIAKEAANLIIVEDDLAKMVEAIAMGRKIYVNLKKAIQYIISIHIPIILIVFIPLALNWTYPTIFTPVHIIFLEIIMSPTCSIIYENEPMEGNLMLQMPRPLKTTFFNLKEISISIIQGLVVTAGLLLIYQYGLYCNYTEGVVRACVFITLIASNIFLTLANRSFYYSVLITIRYKNNLVPMIIGLTIGITALIVFVPVFSKFFLFEPIGIKQILSSILVAFVSVFWIEIYKAFKRKVSNDKPQITS
jgi:Ca2+-transporting ATPase